MPSSTGSVRSGLKRCTELISERLRLRLRGDPRIAIGSGTAHKIGLQFARGHCKTEPCTCDRCPDPDLGRPHFTTMRRLTSPTKRSLPTYMRGRSAWSNAGLILSTDVRCMRGPHPLVTDACRLLATATMSGAQSPGRACRSMSCATGASRGRSATASLEGEERAG